MTRFYVRIGGFAFAVALAGVALGQPQGDRPLDQPVRDEAAPRREGRRDDEPAPPSPKQKSKELFERDFPGPRDGRPGGDRNGPPKGKGGPGDRRPGEESLYEMNIRVNSESIVRSHDRNGDGQLDRSEWTHIKDAEKFDTDGDGVITLKELMNGPHFTRYGGASGEGGRFGSVPSPGMPGPPGFGGGMMPGPGFMRGGPAPFGEVPGDDPEMRELLGQDHALNEQALALAQHIKRANGEERAKLKMDLVEVVNKHFDVRQKRRELQLKRMEDELQRLREAISSRNKSRESIVTNHMKELIGEERDLEF